MNLKTRVKAGKLAANHCTSVLPRPTTLQVRTRVRAGRLAGNHCIVVSESTGNRPS